MHTALPTLCKSTFIPFNMAQIHTSPKKQCPSKIYRWIKIPRTPLWFAHFIFLTYDHYQFDLVSFWVTAPLQLRQTLYLMQQWIFCISTIFYAQQWLCLSSLWRTLLIALSSLHSAEALTALLASETDGSLKQVCVSISVQEAAETQEPALIMTHSVWLYRTTFMGAAVKSGGKKGASG